MVYFSIVTTCYNSEDTIKDTLNSVLNQSFHDYEYLIFDAGSTDGTLDILREYEKLFNGRMRFISEPDEGIYDGMNKGVKEAKGKYVSILNSDDYYNTDTLKNVYDASKQYSQEDRLPIVFGDIYRIKKNSELIYRYYFNYNRIDKNIPFGHPSMFLPKTIYNAIGLYDYKKYKLAADIDFQYRLYKNKENYKWIVLDQVFTYMREGGATDNLKNISRWTKEMTSLEIFYKKKKKFFAFITIFIGRIGRIIKNRLPYNIQKKLYNTYRLNPKLLSK